MDNNVGDIIAQRVLDNFDSWERKRKPFDRSSSKDGDPIQGKIPISREWVPLSGIVAQKNDQFTCIASATGMKCLPKDKVPKAQGITIHDWHAEVLAIRSFNRFLLEECLDLVLDRKTSSEYIRYRSHEEITETHFQPFAWKDDVSLHMYCSEAPCGDASMELTMAAQEDSTPWTNPSQPNTEDETTTLHGRGYFANLGAVRRKPSRPDAPPTLSKSCSDKIAAKQITSLLSSVTSLLISPRNCYIRSLTLPESQYSEVACTRAFSASGRLSPLARKDWGDGYSFQPFEVITTSQEFAYSKRQPLGPDESLVSSNIASSWTPNGSETIIGGTLQGRKQFSIKGASHVCKRRMWLFAACIADTLSQGALDILNFTENLHVEKYIEVKNGELLRKRRKVKADVRNTLRGWQRNCDEEDWGCDGVGVYTWERV